MKKRSKASGGRSKAPARNATKEKRGASSKHAARDASPVAGESREIRRLARELKEAREQQTAISEVLQIISSSNEELTPVFEAILSHVTRLCEANFGTLSLYLGEEGFRSVATHNTPAAFAELRRTKARIRPRVMMRVAETKQLEHILDIRKQPDWHQEPDTVAFIGLAEARTVLCAPVLRQRLHGSQDGSVAR